MAAGALTRLIERLGAPDDTLSPGTMIKDIAESFGLAHVAYLGIHLPRITRSEPFFVVTYPHEWIAHYRARRYVEIDPAIHETIRSVLPLDWGQFDRRPRRIHQLFGEAEDAGIGSQGTSIPIRGPYGELALFSVSSTMQQKEWAAFRAEVIGQLQIVAHHLHAHVLRSQGATPDLVRLGRQEVEVLKWAAAGKTIADIATIMNIKPRTVRFYMEIARYKLNCLNTSHAVAKAISLNLIPPVY